MRILFVKTSSLGDVIHNCPAVSDVRRRFPDAVIDWVVEESFAGIVGMHPAVRRAIPVAIRRWRRTMLHASTWREAQAFRRALREEGYDVVIDTQGLLKSALIAASARGVRHGFDARSAREAIASRFYDVRHAVSGEMHAVERNRLLTASSLGITSTGGCDYGLESPGGSPIPMQRPFCVLLCMTSRADKLWPEERWAALVRAIAARGWESILPWGSPAEQARCGRIAASAGAGIVPRAMSLAELASLMKDAKAAIGVDTGLAHLAAALGAPAIGLYCGSEPALTGLHGGATAVNLGGPGRVPSAQEVLTALEAIA
ncbi:MAG: lipopolysaccharide heptosyltransferase I [Proteobacteria bacterium]|nr:lipopolysaccharide heptosyltransferase I [Pseudomonadota bacterium]